MKTSLRVIDSTECAKQPRKRVELLEMRPKEEWFVCSLNERGRTVWYLRFTVTGMFPRLYGPFSSKRQAVHFLDRVLSRVLDFSQEFDDYARELGRSREFEKLNWGPLIEHPLLVAHPVQMPRKAAQ